MAVYAITDHSVVINSVDLSDHVKSVSLDMEGADVDTTAMGDTWQEVIMGVKSASLQVEFFNDHAAGETDATMWSAFDTGTAVTFVLKPTSGAVSATNPSYSGSILPNGHSVGGSHGDAAMLSRTYPVTGAVTRATS